MKVCSTNINDLLQDGFTTKFAKYYLNQAETYSRMDVFNEEHSKWALSRGFLADSACWYDLSEKNAESYLSDYDYYRIWPLNDWQRIWINDKLTLKYMLEGTEFSDIMPKYYFYTTKDKLLPLLDNHISNKYTDSYSTFISLLKDKKEFACKPCNGDGGDGFTKLSFVDNCFYINENIVSEKEILEFVTNHPNYVFTEYLNPGGYLSELSPKIHTIRLITINPTGKNPTIIGGYLRIPSKFCGAANYSHLEDDDMLAGYNIFTNINANTGEFYDARLVYANRWDKIKTLDNNRMTGLIENYSKLREIILGIANHFNAVEYLGFDLCISDKGFKCMEINSHSGIKYIQLFQSLYDNKDAESYFKQKIEMIDSLSQDAKISRNGIIR